MTAETNDVELPTIADFLLARRKDAFCNYMIQLLGTLNCLLIFDKNEVLVRQAPLDGSIYELPLISLQPIILYLVYYSTSVGHRGVRRMYDSLRREYYWCIMAADVYITVQSCTDCPRLEMKFRLLRRLDLFPPNGSLEFVAIDILGPLPRTSSSNKFVFIITYMYSKVKRAVPTTNITSTQAANIFLNHWAIPYSIHDTILSNSAQQFVSKCFSSVYISKSEKAHSRCVLSRN